MGGTTLKEIPFVNPGSADLYGIDPTVLDDENILADDPLTVLWVRGRDAFTSSGWETRQRYGSAKLTPGNIALPTQITAIDPDPYTEGATTDPAVWAAYSENHAIKFGSGASNGSLMLANALSVHGDEWKGDFTVAFFGRPGPGDNTYIWGNNQVPAATSSGTFFQWTSVGGLSFQVNGVQVIPNTAAANPPFSSLFADGPRLVIIAFSDDTNRCRIRIDCGVYDLEVTGVTALNVESTFRLGTAGPANAGTLDLGDCGELLIRRGYLTDDAAMLARFEGLMKKRYFRRAQWWGASASTSLSAAQVQALSGNGVSTERARSFTVTASNEYVYYAYPTARGAPSSYKINGADATPTVSTVQINSINYTILRSPATLNGSVTVDVT